MKTVTLVSFVSSVAGHAALIGIGPDRCKQAPRQPNDEALVQQTSGTDGGMTNLQGVRCVANSAHQATTEKKIQGWCSDTGDWNNKNRDQGFCLGTTKGTYTSDAHAGLPEAAPGLWGNDKDCTWQAGEDIRVSVHVMQQHKGSHFIDFVPQNAQQLVGLPPCPGSKGPDGTVAPFTPVDKRISDFQVCYQDNVNVADEQMEDWQRKTIRLHPAFAISLHEKEATQSTEFQMKIMDTGSEAPATNPGSYRIDYKFKLPNLAFDADKPALFRWVWMCGYDVQCACTPSNGTWMKPNVTPGNQCPHDDYVAYGMGEIFINCADVTRVQPGGDLPSTQAPVTTQEQSTQAPSTEAPTTTQAATTQAPETTQPAHPCYV
jgi:cell division septation protein DedD